MARLQHYLLDLLEVNLAVYLEAVVVLKHHVAEFVDLLDLLVALC